MATDMDLRSTIAGAAIAGVGAVVVMGALTSSEVASPTIRAILAIVVGVGLAQTYEHVLT